MNKLKEFEELLLDNTLIEVQNQALGNRNSKWKEWWQIVQEFIEEHIHDNMELAHSDEQSYKLELQVYQITLLDFKYETPSLVSVEMRINNKVSATPFVVQLVIKLVIPLKGGTGLEITPLHVHIFIIHVIITNVVNQPVEGNERSNKK
jgi:hypothetical protein